MKRNYSHTSDNESETLSEPELKNIIPDIEPEPSRNVYEWMLKPNGKGGFFKIRFEEATYKRNIKNGWKLE